VSSYDLGDDDEAVDEVVEGFAVAPDELVAVVGVVDFALLTPPWLEHAPLPVAVLVVPSMQVVVAGAAACENAAAGTRTAANAV
jgi:hypothetical protein